MKLTVLDRIEIMNIVPAQGDFATLAKVKLLKDKIQLTEKELKDSVIVDGERLSVKENDKTVNEFEVSELLTEVIVNALKKLNEESKLTINHLGLYEMLVEKRVDGKHD